MCGPCLASKCPKGPTKSSSSVTLFLSIPEFPFNTQMCSKPKAVWIHADAYSGVWTAKRADSLEQTPRNPAGAEEEVHRFCGETFQVHEGVNRASLFAKTDRHIQDRHSKQSVWELTTYNLGGFPKDSEVYFLSAGGKWNHVWKDWL